MSLLPPQPLTLAAGDGRQLAALLLEAAAARGAVCINGDGFFAERHRDSLWRGALDWIDGRCG